MSDTTELKKVVGQVLEGWTLPDGVRKMLETAYYAAAAEFRGPAGFAPEEIADGNRGIRWIMADGVYGRPSNHDVREYLERTPIMNMCECDKCKALYTAPPAARDWQKAAEQLELANVGLSRQNVELKQQLKAASGQKLTESYSIEGTVRFLRQKDIENQVCICCPPKTGHIFGRTVDWDKWDTKRPEHFGNGPGVFVSAKVTDQNRNEGKRVRLTVEVLSDSATASDKEGA